MNHRQIATTSSTILPAPMSASLGQRVAVALNKIDPEGPSFSIAAVDALPVDDLAVLDRRSRRIASCLTPAGEQAAAVALGSMQLMMMDGVLSEQEADKALDLWIKNLADLPSFAIEAATRDFLRGDAGDRGFVPKLPIFRQHAATKVRPHAAEKEQIEKLLKAHENIRPAKSNPDRRAAVVAKAVASLRAMKMEGQKAEATRAGRTFDETPTEEPQQSLERLAAEKDKPITPLSLPARTLIGVREPDPFVHDEVVG